jgi:hypothetical protein
MARGARRNIQRLSIYEESALATPSLGTIQHIGGFSEMAYTATQDMFEDVAARDDRNAKRAPWQGEYKNTLSFKAPLSKMLVPQLGSVFKSALGAVQNQTALGTLSAMTATSFTYGAGEPDQWVAVIYASGRIEFRPVVRKAAGVAYYGYQLPTAVGISSIMNAKDFGALSGRCYYEAPGADMLSFGGEVDRHSEPDQVKFTLNCMVPTSIGWEMTPGSRKHASFAFEGRDHTKNVAANVAAATKPTKHSPSWQTDCYLLTDFDSPGATPSVTKITSYKLQFAPKWLNNESSQSRSGATNATLPKSSLAEWRRDDPMQEDIEIVLAYADNTHNDNFEAEVDYQIAIVDYLGNPGSTSWAGDAHCTYLPKARLKMRPEIAENNGIDGMRLVFHGADERDAGNTVGQMSSALLTKLAFAQFIA